MKDADFILLKNAAHQLESSSLATSLSQVVGIPIEKAMSALPGHWSDVVARATQKALEKALNTALYSLKKKQLKPKNKTHALFVSLSGAIGGTFGITALAVELPISATIMLRSIADIARSHGEDLEQLESQMACLTVFALSGGSRSQSSEAADTSYYAIRSFLTKTLGDTATHLAVHGLSEKSSPIMVKFIHAISTRFAIPVSEKLAVQSIPVIGAVSGASINYLFIQHYQKMAKAHFSIRLLERQYGESIIKTEYQHIASTQYTTHTSL